MKTINIPHTQRELNKFAAEQWEKTLAFLQGHFSLSRTDCEDVFQESFIILYQNIIDGKLDNITSSLSTYFNAICRNKAYELLRSGGKELNIIDEYPSSTRDEYEDERIDRLLALEDDTELVELRKEALVREIVKELPEPCDKILWGCYRDGFSMQTMAHMFGYKSEGSVKVTKHRCVDKFKSRFMELAHRFMD